MPSLMIVADDWFAASLVRRAAEHAGFRRISQVGDGYAALAQTWELAANERCPNAYFIECDSAGDTAAGLVKTLRGDERTQSAVICAFSMREPPAVPGADLAACCHWDQEELDQLLAQMAQLALALQVRQAERRR